MRGRGRDRGGVSGRRRTRGGGWIDSTRWIECILVFVPTFLLLSRSLLCSQNNCSLAVVWSSTAARRTRNAWSTTRISS